MATVKFNFGYEQQVIEGIELNDETGVVTFESNGVESQYESMTEFAQLFASLRGVKSDHYKNWKLIKDGDLYIYAQKAGTAGIAIGNLTDELLDIELEPQHRLEIIRITLDSETLEDAQASAMAIGLADDVTLDVLNALSNMRQDVVVKELALDGESVTTTEHIEPEIVEEPAMAKILEEHSIIVVNHVLGQDLTTSSETLMGLFVSEDDTPNARLIKNQRLETLFYERLRNLQSEFEVHEGDALEVLTTNNAEVVTDDVLVTSISESTGHIELDEDRFNKVKTFVPLTGRTFIKVKVLTIGKHIISEKEISVDISEIESDPTGYEFKDTGEVFRYIYSGDIDAEFRERSLVAEIENIQHAIPNNEYPEDDEYDE